MHSQRKLGDKDEDKAEQRVCEHLEDAKCCIGNSFDWLAGTKLTAWQEAHRVFCTSEMQSMELAARAVMGIDKCALL
eukprot:SAG31_NODE_6600_length_1956_cov_1.208401_2_plen_77_part_00